MKKFTSVALLALLSTAALGACSSGTPAATTSASAAASTSASAAGGGEKKIVIISKSYQNQFYQASFKGAEDAAKELGVSLTTNGPDAESNVAQQVEQLAAAINQKPAAVILAASDPNAVQDTLATAKTNGIPVIGFDSGVPGDKSGAVVATAATDNTTAGANVATNLAADKGFQAASPRARPTSRRSWACSPRTRRRGRSCCG